jgi:hypothetical protein
METIRIALSEAVEKVLSGEITHALSSLLILKAHLHLDEEKNTGREPQTGSR